MRYSTRNSISPQSRPGLYVIEYAGQRTAPFRSQRLLREHLQDSLDHHLRNRWIRFRARSVSRVARRSHLDDGRMAPVVGEQFDNWNQLRRRMASTRAGSYSGMNVGGWYDAGDFDLEEPRNSV